jgi:hypothetical protein
VRSSLRLEPEDSSILDVLAALESMGMRVVEACLVLVLLVGMCSKDRIRNILRNSILCQVRISHRGR